MTNETGPRRVIVYTGNGKGKTTAALGLVVRAAGHGHRVLVLQFIKDNPSIGELTALDSLSGVTIEQSGLGFVPKSTHPAFEKHRKKAQEGLGRAETALKQGSYDLVVLDEICVAIGRELIEEELLLEILDATSDKTCVVMTGRGASEKLQERADTVTEMRCIRHAFEQGREAEQGVEW